MLPRSFFYTAFLFFAFCRSSAQQKYSNEFLNIGVGARAFGLSQAFVAGVDDVTAGYWNPAGLTGIRGNTQAELMHAEYFAGLAKYDYAGFATAIADNTAVIGASIIRFGVDDIPDTSELIDSDGNINYDRVKSFSAADYAFIFSYARGKGLTDEDGLSYGANAKIIHRKIGEYGKSYGFGLDAGVQYRTGNWIFAAMGRDITTTYNSWSYNPDKLSTVYTTTGNEIPQRSTELTYPRIVLGTMFEKIIGENFSINTELDLNVSTDGKRNVLVSSKRLSLDPTMGLEAGFKNIVFFRTGVGNLQKSANFEGDETFTFQPNMGLGIRIKNLAIDYALTDIGNSSDALYSNVFSLRLNFGRQ